MVYCFRTFKKLLIFSLIITLFFLNDVNSLEDDSDYRRPEFSATKIDSPVKQIVYCNSKQIATLSNQGTVLLSHDAGFSLDSQDTLFQETAKEKVDVSENEIGHIREIVQSQNAKSTLFFLGTQAINWISHDCGHTIEAFNHGRRLEDFHFHPTNSKWIIATAFTQESDENVSSIYKELFISKDGGYTWKLLIDFVDQVSWGAVSFENIKYGVPKERILVIRHENTNEAKDKQKALQNRDFIFSDDFFISSKVSATKIEEFVINEDIIYLVKNDGPNKHILHASTRHFTYNFEPIFLGQSDSLKAKSIHFAKTDKDVIIHINNYNSKSSLGNIFFNYPGIPKLFTKSIKNGLIDHVSNKAEFVEINGIPGTFLANVVEKKGNVYDFHLNSEEDAISRNNKPNIDAIRLYNEAIEDSIKKAKEDELVVLTKISFDRGNSWHFLNAPIYDSDGKAYPNCDREKGQKCYLHLFNITSDKKNSISKQSAIGIIVANGTVSSERNYKHEKQNQSLFMSRDGGRSWRELAKHAHIFNIGDHGGIIVFAKDGIPTNELTYTKDDGYTFEKIRITIDPILIEQIEVIDNSLNFIVRGKEVALNKNTDSINFLQTGRGISIGINFQRSFVRRCNDPGNPERKFSDYEAWSPHSELNRDVIGSDCVLGQKWTYIRRKTHRDCYNGDMEIRHKSEACKCRETDYQCDYGYARKAHFGPCEKIFSVADDDYSKIHGVEISNECKRYITRGYIKQPGNKCYGGIDFNPSIKQCPSEELKNDIVKVFLIFLFIAIAAVILFYMRKIYYVKRQNQQVIRDQGYYESRPLDTKSKKKDDKSKEKGFNSTYSVNTSINDDDE